MAIFACLRVSTSPQDVTQQRLAILEFTGRERLTVDNFLELDVHSGRLVRQHQVDQALARLASGDTLIVSALSRLGGSVGEIVTIVDTLVQRQIRLLAIKEGMRLDGKRDLRTRVMVTMFALLAEIEHELIARRSKEALAAARASGRRLGRPQGRLGKSKLDGQAHEIQRLLALRVSKASIAKIMGVDRATLYHFIRSRGIV
jgi:DNA invertase Pin-like site-specific DNA recombinase